MKKTDVIKTFAIFGKGSDGWWILDRRVVINNIARVSSVMKAFIYDNDLCLVNSTDDLAASIDLDDIKDIGIYTNKINIII